MTYDPTSPKAQLSPEMSPDQIKTNFIVFANAISTNHVAMNSLGQGRHTKVVFKAQTIDPIVESTFGVVYAKLAVQASGNALNLFYRTITFNQDIPSIPQQMTFNIITLTGATVGGVSNMQQSFLFGGFITYTGTFNISGVNPVVIDVAAIGSGIPVPTKLVYAKVNGTTNTNGNGWGLTLSSSGSTFNVPKSTGISGPVKYFAIGIV